MTQIDFQSRMKKLFFPGPVLLFIVGWVNTSGDGIQLWLLILAIVISVPCSLAFGVAGIKAFYEEKAQRDAEKKTKSN